MHISEYVPSSRLKIYSYQKYGIQTVISARKYRHYAATIRTKYTNETFSYRH